MAKRKKGGTKRRSTGTSSKGWMDKAKLFGTVVGAAALATTVERWQDGKSLNPFSKAYWTGAA